MITTLDISTVTDRLVELLEAAITASRLWSPIGPVTPFNIAVSGSMPEEVRNKGGCQLSMYLFHINTQPFTRNMSFTPNAAQDNKEQPLGLTLYYLLSAYSKENPQQEQQAMSIAIKALHERATYVAPDFTFTITMEEEKPDEANRRWQAYSTPFRLAMVYRVSVIFLAPDRETAEPAEPPSQIGLSVSPSHPGLTKGGWLANSASRAVYQPYPAQPGEQILHDYSPALGVPGSTVLLMGKSLDQPTSQRLYLLDGGGAEVEVTAWRRPAAGQNASRALITLPSAVGAPPGASPTPGVYLLRVGSAIAQGDAMDYRSNSVPLSFAARIDPVPTPWLAVGGVFSLWGVGFMDGHTEVIIDTAALLAVTPGADPEPGQFALNPAGTGIAFRLPDNLPPGSYVVRVRVRGVEGPPPGEVSAT